MYIGIDLGGTKIAAGLANTKGKILKHITVPTAKQGSKVIEQINKVIADLSKTTKADIKAIGIGLPGQIDAKGKIFNMPNIPSLVGTQLLKNLSKKYKYVIENDANAAALAEHKFGAGKKLKNFIYITISTGIGGGIVLDGKLYSGTNKSAGEVGHMVIVPHGPKCGCGNRGCWEVMASGTALARLAKEKIAAGEYTLINNLTEYDSSKVTAEVIVEAAKQEDPLAIELLDNNGYYNALGIANLANIFDPQAIIIGGGLSFNGQAFYEPLKRNLAEFKILNPSGKIKILPAGCRKNTGLLGALALVVSC